MSSLQSVIIRLLLRCSNMWNKPLPEIRKTLGEMKINAKNIILPKQENVSGVPCEVYLPEVPLERKAILYFHGGGFCLGIYDATREFISKLTRETEVKVYLADYRLSPESPFPAALEDAINVYKGMLKEGYSAKDIVVMGDSSGCGLALAALQTLNQGKIEMPLALIFITPVFDFAGGGESFSSRAGKDPFKLKDPLGIAKIYLKNNDPFTQMISPIYGEFKGMPRIFIHAADYDVFLSDACRVYEKAEAAGVEVKLKVWKKMWHLFHMQNSIVPEARNAFMEMTAYIRDIM